MILNEITGYLVVFWLNVKLIDVKEAFLCQHKNMHSHLILLLVLIIDINIFLSCIDDNDTLTSDILSPQTDSNSF